MRQPLCGRVEDETEIKVYSNQPKVALYVNGALVEEKEGEHIFIFHIPNVGEQTITAKAGELSDEIAIRKVDTPNPDYAFKEQTSVKNWFEEEGMEVIPGYYSIKDTLGDISKSPEGAAFVEQMQANLAQNSSMASMAEGVVITDQIRQMMQRFTVENLLKQAGDIDPQMVIAINKQLNKIKNRRSNILSHIVLSSPVWGGKRDRKETRRPCQEDAGFVIMKKSENGRKRLWMNGYFFGWELWSLRLS